jgi:hypothetical protein
MENQGIKFKEHLNTQCRKWIGLIWGGRIWFREGSHGSGDELKQTLGFGRINETGNNLVLDFRHTKRHGNSSCRVRALRVPWTVWTELLVGNRVVLVSMDPKCTLSRI